MSGRTYEQVQEQEYSPLFQTKLPTDYKLVLYARQSQKDAPITHKESYEQQTIELVEYAKKLGWTEDKVIILIENKRKDGRWRKASGTLRIDQREGLQTTVGLIETDDEEDKCKAVMVWAVDRLFRHEDMIESHVFVKICKEHHCIVITHDDLFDFNHPTRGDADRKRFLDLCQQAADYVTKHVKGRMIPAANRVSRRGEYDGRCLPIGFYVLEGEKKPQAYAPQIEVIRNRIFKRYRELDARFNLLWREIGPIRDLFPPYPSYARGVKPHMKEGPFGITRDTLIGILTNPAYGRYWYFKEKGKATILIPDIYPFTVDDEDFWFSFNHTSKTTITGELNELRSITPPARFDRVGTVSAMALLDGIVTSPMPGNHVYVFQRADKPNKAEYAIEGRGYETGSQVDEGYILVRDLDRIFEERLKYRICISKAIEDVIKISGSGKPTETSMYEYLKSVQAMTNQALAGVSSQISEYRQEIANIERTLRLNAHLHDDESIIKMGERLKNLNTTLKELEKKDEKRIEEKDLKEVADLIVEASVSYDSVAFEKKQKLVRLVTTRLQLSILAPRWLLLNIAWSPFLGVLVEDIAFIWHPYGSGGKWSDEEIDILRSMYQTEEKDKILQALYSRSWSGIKHMASEKGLRRLRWLKDSTLPDILSMSDYDVIQKNELEYNEPGRRVWWKSVLVQKNGTNPTIKTSKKAG